MNLVDRVGKTPSVSQSLTLGRKDKVKHYIRLKVHNPIIENPQSRVFC